MILLTDEPTIEEVEYILRRISFVPEYHKQLDRKLKDLKGIYSSFGEVQSKFIDYCKSELKLSPFNSILYSNYVTRRIDIHVSNWRLISKFLYEHNYIGNATNTKHCFTNLQSAITWLVAYRCTIECFNIRFRCLDYERSWLEGT